jgi:tetratricopeptide (TPR) repeat protein
MNGPDRLWPVLTVLATLLAGAGALERVGRGRGGESITIAIAAGRVDGSNAGDDDAGEGDDGEIPAASPAVSPSHAQARQQARRGDLAKALELLRGVVNAEPQVAALRSELGYWLLAAGRADEAIEHLARAAQLAPNDASVAYNLGVARRRAKDATGAEREFRRALDVRPAYGPARLALGAGLRRRRAYDESIAVLQPAADSGGNDERADALVALGRSLLAAGQRARAEKAFEDAVSRAPGRVDVRLQIGRAFLTGDRPEDAQRAIDVLTRAVALAPDVARVQSALARALEKRGDDAGAEAAYERAARLDPSYTYPRRRLLRLARLQADRLLADAGDVPEHHFLAALVSARQGRPEDARARYLAAIERAGGNYPEAYFNLGILEKDAGDLAAAIAAYDKAIAQRPDYLAALNNRGVAYAAAGRTGDAEASYRRALAADSGYAAGWRNLGELLIADARYGEAIEALRQAVAARPGYHAAKLELGIAYARAGREGDALSTFDALTAEQPRYQAAWFNLATALVAAGRADAARAAYTKSLALDHGHAPSLRGLADLEARGGNAGEAQRLYTEVIEREPADQAARLALADLLRSAGDFPGCLAQARAVLTGDASETRARRIADACGTPAPTRQP